MRTSAGYRAEAKGYVLQAEGVTDPARRARLLEMAQSCIRLADQAEWLSINFPELKGNGSDVMEKTSR
jgi:hypothetical protein